MTWLHVVVFILIALVGGLVAWCWSLSDDLEAMRDEVDEVARKFDAVKEAHTELHAYVGNLALDTADDTYGRHHHSGSTKWAA